MANSTSNIDTISQSQASKEVTANAFFDAASQSTTYGRRASTSSGLTWGYYGGNVTKTDGTLAQIANGTVTLTASTTNYLVANRATGAVSVSTATTNWNNQTDYHRLYQIVTGTSTVSSYTDARQGGWNGNVAGLVGYGTGIGQGGAVTQATSKATGVTLNTPSGAITMNAANLAAGASASFTLTCSAIGANDFVGCHRKSGGTANSYRVEVDSVAAGSAVITVTNKTGGDLAEAVVLTYAVIKGAVS